MKATNAPEADRFIKGQLPGGLGTARVKPSRLGALVFVALAVLAAALAAHRPSPRGRCTRTRRSTRTSSARSLEGAGLRLRPRGVPRADALLPDARPRLARRARGATSTSTRRRCASVPAAVGIAARRRPLLARPVLGPPGALARRAPRARSRRRWSTTAGTTSTRSLLVAFSFGALLAVCRYRAAARARSRRSSRAASRGPDARHQGDGAARARLHAAGARGAASSSAARARGRAAAALWPAAATWPLARPRGAPFVVLLLVVPRPPGGVAGRGAGLRPLPRARDRRLAARPPVALLPRPARALSRERHALLDRGPRPRPRRRWAPRRRGRGRRARGRCPGSCASSPSTRAACSRLLRDPLQDALVPARLPARDDPARGSGRRRPRAPRPRHLGRRRSCVVLLAAAVGASRLAGRAPRASASPPTRATPTSTRTPGRTCSRSSAASRTSPASTRPAGRCRCRS